MTKPPDRVWVVMDANGYCEYVADNETDAAAVQRDLSPSFMHPGPITTQEYRLHHPADDAVRAAFDEWLSKSEWVRGTATPGELGMHLADVLRQRIERLAAERDSLRAEVERLRADAELYRWLRGGSDVPSHSLRWPRWEVRRWDGRYWQTLFGKQIDDLVAADIERDRLSIDAARAAQEGK